MRNSMGGFAKKAVVGALLASLAAGTAFAGGTGPGAPGWRRGRGRSRGLQAAALARRGTAGRRRRRGRSSGRGWRCGARSGPPGPGVAPRLRPSGLPHHHPDAAPRWRRWRRRDCRASGGSPACRRPGCRRFPVCRRGVVAQDRGGPPPAPPSSRRTRAPGLPLPPPPPPPAGDPSGDPKEPPPLPPLPDLPDLPPLPDDGKLPPPELPPLPDSRTSRPCPTAVRASGSLRTAARPSSTTRSRSC